MKRDKRVTVYRFRLKYLWFLVIGLILLVTAGACIGIYYSIPRGSFELNVYATLSVLTFVLVVSSVLVAVMAAIYNKNILSPVEKLSEAAKKVAEGDLSVRLAPQRKDGKKDEFEVLFDDFNTMVSEIASTEILKKDFVSNVSHEFKTPLSVIGNYSSILTGDSLTEAERKEYAVKIKDACARLSKLVTDILQLSRLENQKIVADKKRYNLSEQLCRCIIGFENIWNEKDICIDTDFDTEIEIYSDEDLMDVVWNNLLSNALKFTPNGGKVAVSAKCENGFAVVTVSDDGCGMNEHDLKHVFDKFYQADRSHATQGNGLGLALTREIVTLAQGEIDAESEEGKGSRFTVKLRLES